MRRDIIYWYFRFWVHTLIIVQLFICLPFISFAIEVGDTYPSFIYQGRLTDSLDRGITTSSVTFTLDVLAPNNSQCILYEEVFTKDLSQADGFFTLQVGTGIVTTSSLSIKDTFSNTLSAKTGVGGCSYVPTAGEARDLKIKVQEQGQSQVTFDNQTIVASPYATVAQSLKGLAETDFVRIINSNSITNMQSRIETLVGSDYSALTTLAEGSTYSALTALAGGTSNLYLKPGSVVFSNAAPSSPSSGQMWYDSTNKNIKYYDGTSTKELVTPSNTVNGSLNMALTAQGVAQYKITNLAAPTTNNDAANKLYVDTTVSTAVTAGVAAANATTLQTKAVASSLSTLASGDSGKVLKWNGAQWIAEIPILGMTTPGASENGKAVMWNYSTGTWDYYVPGVAGAGLQSLNSQTGNTQSLDTAVASVTSPTFYSTSNTHTLRYPLASATGVTAGLISKSDYDTFNGKQAAITSSSTVTTGTLTSHLQGGLVLDPFNTSAGNTGEIRFKELAANGANYVGFKAPDTLTVDKIWTLPSGDGTAGQLLKTDGAGNLSWVTDANAGGTVTSVSSANSDISVTSATTAPQLTLNVGTSGGAGDASKIAKLSGSGYLGSGMMPALTGDVSMSAGTTTTSVDKVKGTTVSATPTLSGQVLRYNGTTWTPNFVSMLDLRSNVTGSTALANSCSAAQTLTYNSVSDNLTCTNIAITNSQVSGLGALALKASVDLSTSDASGTLATARLPAFTGGDVTSSAGSAALTLSTVTASKGGTGQTTYTTGDLLYASAATALSKLGVGTNGQVLTSNGTTPSWVTPTATGQWTTSGSNIYNANEGNVGIGTTSPGSKLSISDTVSNQATLYQYSTDANPPRITFRKTRGTSSSPSSVTNGDKIGDLLFQGTPDGTNFKIGAIIAAYVDAGTVSGSSMPSYLSLGTTANNAVVSTERMRIDSAGNIGIGMTNPSVRFAINGITGSPATFTNALIGLGGGAGVAALALGTDDTTPGGEYAWIQSHGSTPLYINKAGNNTIINPSSGNVGIGTTNPSQRLEIFGNIAMRDNSGAYNSTWSTAPGMINFGSASNHNLAFLVNNNERMRIDTTGNVGIGTSTPLTKLQIQFAEANTTYSGAGQAPNGLYLYNTDPTTNALSLISWGGSRSGTALGSIGIVNTAPATASISEVGDLVLATKPLGSSFLSERMRINSSGNVGIGTVSPGYPLDVSGAIRTSSSFYSTYGSALTTPTSDGLLLNAPGGSGNYSPVIRFDIGGGGGRARLYTSRTGSAGGRLYIDTEDTSGTSITRMFINESGNVGIGITNPGQRLQVGSSGDGSVAIANAWNTFSDIRLKKDLEKIPNACELVDQLNGYYYYWKNGDDRSRQIGVIAQEVEKVLPELVKTGSDGIKTVDYPKLTAILIEASQQHNRDIASVKDEIAAKDKAKDQKIKELEQRLEKIEKALNSK